VRRSTDGLIDIAETFGSIQGEGLWVGTPMFFIRFAHCNLNCPWCDTDYRATERVSVGELITRVITMSAPHVCITGGEPFVQREGLTKLVRELARRRIQVHVETNGTYSLCSGASPSWPAVWEWPWLTVSPKAGQPVRIERADEIKVVVLDDEPLPDLDPSWPQARDYFVQPEWSGGNEAAVRLARKVIEHAGASPSWKMSIQAHKLIGLR